MSGQHRPACDRPVCRAYRVAIPVCRPIVIKSFGKDAAFPGTACPNERWMSVSRPQGGRMKRLLIALVLVGACGTSEEQANQSGAEAQPGDAVADAVRTAGLTGLYEGKAGTQTNPPRIVDSGRGDPRFESIVWGGKRYDSPGTGRTVGRGRGR